MTKFKGIYRIESCRRPGWDYGANAIYFVTICIKNKIKYFGEIRSNVMGLSNQGMIANKCWLEIPDHFPFVKLHTHIIMPDHVHGIIEIAKNESNVIKPPAETQNIASLRGTQTNNHHSQNSVNFTIRTKFHKNKFGPQSQNLGSIIRGYKVGVTKNIRKEIPEFSWQKNYHDIIIKDEQAFVNISNYIKNNPRNWKNKTHP